MPVKKFSISVSQETYKAVEEAVAAGEFRSVSHLFEDGAKMILRKKQSEKSENPL
jgi:Arc/MetJ-type ribon-helix-helix transcriptional regulator